MEVKIWIKCCGSVVQARSLDFEDKERRTYVAFIVSLTTVFGSQRTSERTQLLDGSLILPLGIVSCIFQSMMRRGGLELSFSS